MTTTDYDTMTDDKLSEAIGLVVGRDFLSPFIDANALREIKIWAMEEHDMFVSIYAYEGTLACHIDAPNHVFVETHWDHDNTRRSIIRGEARVTITAILRALEMRPA